jgi:membrane protein implicated in regulation of membrane protease activity
MPFILTLIAVAWLYVVLIMSAAEALSSQGSVLGALITLLLYGALPLSLVLYLLSAPARRRARRAAESATPDRHRVAAGDAVAPEREEP